MYLIELIDLGGDPLDGETRESLKEATALFNEWKAIRDAYVILRDMVTGEVLERTD